MIIEINGIKMDVDERTAKVQKVDTFKIGDPVKVLQDKSYSSPVLKYGVIVGFDQFKSSPTITVAYIDYSEIKFLHINDKTKHEMLAVESHDLMLDKVWIIDKMNANIRKKELELEEAKNQKNLFESQFGKYFKDGTPDFANVNSGPF